MEPVKVAIIGAGARAIAFCKFLAENPNQAELVAIIDYNLEKANFLNTYFNLKATVADDYDVLRDAQAVLIITPDYAHVAPTCAALKMGKHVYIEKPLATTIEDCDKIAEAAAQSKSMCYLGFNLRHHPVNERIHSLIVKNELGKVTTIEANEYYYGGRTYFRRWNRLVKYGGGLWLTKACHDFDLLKWLSGGNTKSVYAVSNLSYYKHRDGAGPRCRDCRLAESCPDFYDVKKPLEDWFDETWRQLQHKMDQSGELAPDICLYNSDKDTFDNGITVVEFDNDIRATYTVNVLAARCTRQVRVVGTEAMIEADLEYGTILLTRRHTHETLKIDLSEQTKGTHGGADFSILSDFFKICRQGGIPRSSIEDGRSAVQMSLAARKSAETGSRVLIDKDDVPSLRQKFSVFQRSKV
jgi:predicted dehydrogenase